MDLATIISCVAALAALITALASLIAIRTHTKSNEANFFLTVSEVYSSDEMQTALFTLVKLYKENPSNFLEVWQQKFKERDAQAKEIDACRRRISRYFTNIARLYSGGFISKRLTNKLINCYGINVYYQIVTPIDELKDGGHPSESALILKTIRGKFRDGNILNS